MCLTCAFTKYKVTTSKFKHCSASHALCPIFEGFLIVPCLSFRRSSSHLPRIQHYIHALIIILVLCGLFCICPFVFKLMACRSSLLEGDAQTSRFIDRELNKNHLSLSFYLSLHSSFCWPCLCSPTDTTTSGFTRRRINSESKTALSVNIGTQIDTCTRDLLDLRLLVLLQSLHA